MTEITADLLLRAYAFGVFPMAERRTDKRLFWVDPDRRGVLPLAQFHIPRSLRKVIRQGRFTVTCDTAFDAVLAGCAESTEGRPETWINDQIHALFVEIFEMGFAHSVEVWEEGQLVGGLYGACLGAAFFGESMFSRRSDASKVALVHLVARLVHGSFVLLDTQFVTGHLTRFGAIEIARPEYRQQLADAIRRRAVFQPDLPEEAFAAFLQSTTQTS